MVDNAGAMFQTRIEGPDGIEATVALMVAGPFVLIGGLLPLLERTEGSRVIAVTSGGMYTQPLDLDDLESRDEPFSGPRAYARAKRAQVTLMREWARRLAPAGVSFSAMHPGWADTPGLAESLPRFHRLTGPLLRTPARASTRSCGLRQRRHRDRERESCSSTDVRGRSIAFRRRAWMRPTAGDCGTSSWR